MPQRGAGWRIVRLLTGTLAAAGLVGACDLQNIAELEPGVSTEQDVRDRFGAPEAVWDGPDGAQIYEYNRQPMGHVNYMITIGPDGRMVRLSQVLTEENFAQVQPGQPMEEVRRRLGKPMKITTYALKRETHYDWRYLPVNDTQSMVFTVVFNPDMRVVNTMKVIDPDTERNR